MYFIYILGYLQHQRTGVYKLFLLRILQKNLVVLSKYFLNNVIILIYPLSIIIVVILLSNNVDYVCRRENSAETHLLLGCLVMLEEGCLQA